MRILIANYRYFVSSGPERYLFNVKAQLEALGHTVMPFSIHYAANQHSEYERHFVSPIGGADQVFFDQHDKSLSTKLKALSRLFYSREVENAVGNMVDETRPDVAYILYYLRKLSPSLLVGIKKRRIPIVARISDYGMMCGEHHMLRNGEPCTLCLSKGLLSEARHRCIKGSFAMSAVDVAATSFHRARGYFDLIDKFVTTNPFMSEMMIRSGVEPSRIECIPTFTDLERFQPGDAPAEPPYLLYVGRLDKPKGVHLLIEMMAHLREEVGTQLPVLKIAGSGHTQSYVDELTGRVAELGLGENVQFLGAVPADRIPELMRHAYCSLMPALWYENLPNSVIESLASGCPVITAEIGSLSYTITHGVDGLKHEAGDALDLSVQVRRILGDRPLRDSLARGARATAERAHAPQTHVTQLMQALTKLTLASSVPNR